MTFDAERLLEKIMDEQILSARGCHKILRLARTLADFNDEEVIKELTSLKGVGEWTAEMLLIHSLERPNILSFKDLGIRRGIMRLYGLADISKKEFEVYRRRYSPHCTVASLYLWEISM